MHGLSLTHNIEELVKTNFDFSLEYNQDLYSAEITRNSLLLDGKLITEITSSILLGHLDNLFQCLSNEIKLSKEVYSNAYRIIESLYPTILIKTIPELIYISSYNTVIMEWENGEDIFSLDIGRDTLGYFNEINGEYTVEENISFTKDSYKSSLGHLLINLSSFIS